MCLIKSLENEHLYWAIPLGNWEHRSENAKERIELYTSLPQKDIRSCYYHIGNTDVTSIFFISDAVSIIDKYIEREYVGKYTGSQYVIQNSVLIRELNRKLQRILSWENSHPNSFRQHITIVKNYLIQELDSQILKDNRGEVRSMLLTEYDEQAPIEYEKESSYEEGKTEGRKEGREEERER